MPRPPDKELELTSDLALQERVWRAERLSWIVFVLLLIAALLGVFGSGPLAHASHRDPGGRLVVHYERLMRHSTMAALSFSVMPRGDSAEVWISNRFLREIQIERIVPEPRGMASDAERTLFRFEAASPDHPVRITWHVTPLGYGPLELAGGTPGVPAFHLPLFVYP